jgi:hypothetical protein
MIPGVRFLSGDGLKVFQKGFHGTLAESTLKLAMVIEEDPKHFGDDEDDLTMGDSQYEIFSHPFSPFFQPLSMAGGTERSCLAGKG